MSSEAPLADAAEAFLADPGTTFTVPGHKRTAGLGDALLQRDLPLVSGADDSRQTGALLGRAEGLAAELWGADWCRFSVNGSTHGNQTLALAAARPGAPVVVSRTLHKSLFAGLVLAGLEPVWVRPEVDPATGLALGVPPERVAAALAATPEASAVFVTEPSYVGVVSDVEALATLAHAGGLPLVVDQAWGAHFGFHPALPAGALSCGADGVVISAHKNLTAFTQGAIVMAREERLERDRLEQSFELLNTTSPAAGILASLDRSRQLMADRGAELLGATIELVAAARAGLAKVEGLTVLDAGLAERHASVAVCDPTKLVLALAGTGADGFEVEADLWAEGIRLEMADRDTLVPIVTVGDGPASLERLVEALERSLERRRSAARPPASSSVWRLEPEQAISPREAFFAARERVAADAAVGRVAAETAAPYPPGIPALAPGELVTAPLLEALRAEAAAGSRIAYCSDPTLETLLVVAR